MWLSRPTVSPWATTTTLILLLTTPIHAQLSKPSLFAGFPSNLMTDLENRLGTQQYSLSSWDPNWIPAACREQTVQRGLNTSDISVANIKYPDCDGQWAVCRHKDATSAGFDRIASILGKLPVGMRQFAANVLIVPDSGSGGCATVGSGPIMITTAGCWSVGVALHEMTHVIDYWAFQDVLTANGYPWGQISYSQSRLWLGAYDKDEYVVTNYARSSHNENFAELSVFAMSDRLTPGGVAIHIGNSQRLAINDQLGDWRWRMEPHIWTSTGRCTSAKKVTTPAVTKSTGAKKARAVGNDVNGSEASPEAKLLLKFPLCDGLKNASLVS